MEYLTLLTGEAAPVTGEAEIALVDPDAVPVPDRDP